MSPLIRRAALALCLIVGASACTPAQMASWLESNDLPVPEDEQVLTEQAAWAESAWRAHLDHLVLSFESGPFGWPWDQLVQCEAGGNWHVNSGNGYSGGLQFVHSTWIANGGGAYAPMAYQASPRQQIAVAQRIVASSGGTYGAWPGCRAHLGLP